jgi:hypothetical protein
MKLWISSTMERLFLKKNIVHHNPSRGAIVLPARQRVERVWKETARYSVNVAVTATGL